MKIKIGKKEFFNTIFMNNNVFKVAARNIRVSNVCINRRFHNTMVTCNQVLTYRREYYSCVRVSYCNNAL